MKSVAKDTPWRSWPEGLRGTGKGRVHDRRVNVRLSGLLIENGSAPLHTRGGACGSHEVPSKIPTAPIRGSGAAADRGRPAARERGWHSPLLTRGLLPTFLATIRCSLEMFVAPEPGALRRRSALALDRTLGSYNAADGLIVTTLGFVGAAVDICSRCWLEPLAATAASAGAAGANAPGQARGPGGAVPPRWTHQREVEDPRSRAHARIRVAQR